MEGNPSNLTVDVLKQATRALKHKSPILDDILRLGGREQGATCHPTRAMVGVKCMCQLCCLRFCAQLQGFPP